MFSFLEKQKYSAILLVVGVVLFLLGYFQVEKVDDVSSISLRAQPIYPILIAGLAFSFLSIAIYVFDELTLELQGSMKTPVEKEIGVTQDSYGVGTGVFLEQPMGSEQPVLFLSVTTKRAGQGLKAEMSYIFKGVEKVQQIMSDKRLGSVLLPVMGSGHGGLKTEVALFGLLLAICDRVKKSAGHHISKIDAVVFQASDGDQPSITKPAAKRMLRISAGMFSE